VATNTANITNNSNAITQNTQNITANTDKISANTADIAALQAGKANIADVYTKTEINTQIAEVNTNANDKAAAAEASAKSYADSQDTATLAAAKTYTDNLANGSVKDNTDAIAVLNGDANTVGSVAQQVGNALTSANSYTDTTVQNLANGAVATNATNIAANTNAIATNKAAIDILNGDETVVGSVKNAEANAKSYTDALIGTTDVLVEQNGVIKLGTVNNNIAALNNTIGDITDLNQYTEGATIGNALTQGGTQSADTVVAALNNIDATLGTIHGLRDKLATSGGGTNLASGTTVEQHLTALDSAIGNRAYTSTRYISSGSDLSSAVSTLDSNLSRVEGNLDALTHRTQKMHHEMKSGFASLAAMSALVPNARVAGDTQISVGTGHYRGTTGFALGAFHHVNDNILLNAGAAYGGNGSATFKGGLTFGW
ncbi:MAG: YadA-like family protein, partial [Alphaproteobacteria bacterium]|nr:YadA-like family protein [Alphaproteobacteria bacterium]